LTLKKIFETSYGKLLKIREGIAHVTRGNSTVQNERSSAWWHVSVSVISRLSSVGNHQDRRKTHTCYSAAESPQFLM